MVHNRQRKEKNTKTQFCCLTDCFSAINCGSFFVSVFTCAGTDLGFSCSNFLSFLNNGKQKYYSYHISKCPWEITYEERRGTLFCTGEWVNFIADVLCVAQVKVAQPSAKQEGSNDAMQSNTEWEKAWPSDTDRKGEAGRLTREIRDVTPRLGKGIDYCCCTSSGF